MERCLIAWSLIDHVSRTTTPFNSIPAEIACLTDDEPYARQRMRAQDWAYFSAAAADELTLRDNLASFGRWGLWPAALSRFDQPSTRLYPYQGKQWTILFC